MDDHDAPAPDADSAPHAPRIYLAGPDVFHRDRDERFLALKARCTRLGLTGVAPTDAGVDKNSSGSDDERALRIYQGNIRLIREADGVAANLAEFRGEEPDSGTAFEVGFAVALGKPVVIYGVGDGSYAQRVAGRIACTTDAQGTMREAASGIAVEGLGQRLNLMLSCSTRMARDADAALDMLAAHFASARRS